MTEPRIVSLIASATEIVCALGFENAMVGRSHECDFPPSVESLPVCSSSKVDVDGSSRAIDNQVRSIVAEALSVYRVDGRLLDELAPTVIVTQTQCEVCAVSLKDVERAVCELDPLMHAENWVPELALIAGGKVMLGEAGRHSGYFEFEQMMEADPDVIAVMPCGFDIPRTAAEMPPLAAHPGWSDLSAARNGRVFLTDGNQYFNRPGPRMVESAEILAELLHPEVFDFGHRGSGWTEWIGF